MTLIKLLYVNIHESLNGYSCIISTSDAIPAFTIINIFINNDVLFQLSAIKQNIFTTWSTVFNT